MDRKSMKTLHMFAFTLVIIGALNWGLIGLLNLNLVNKIFGSIPAVEQLIYILVGAAALIIAATHMSDCKYCSSKR